MLVEKLNGKDLTLANMKPFDGTFAYAQNKRQQVVMAEQYTKMHPNVYFCSMHPGWADTPGNFFPRLLNRKHDCTCLSCMLRFTAVKSSMPDFHRKMQGKLRTPQQGADTLVWLAIAKNIEQNPGGSFFQGWINY